MRTTKLVNKYKNKHRIRESQTEVDNGVHPLHWAMSPGPSPIGTDPINGFKMVQMVLDSANQFQKLQNRMLNKILQDLLSGKLQIGLLRQRKAKQ